MPVTITRLSADGMPIALTGLVLGGCLAGLAAEDVPEIEKRGEKDLSSLSGWAVTAIGAVSQDHGPGVGIEWTADLLWANISLEAIEYRDAYEGHKHTLCGFVGIGAMNPFMIQIGGGSDGFAVRVHGELAFLNGDELGLYTRRGLGTRYDPVVSYSWGYQRSGAFAAAGIGMGF